MSIFSRGHYYNNCLMSVDHEWSIYEDPTLKVEFMAGPFKLEYNGPQNYFKESFKGAFERFAKKVAKDYDDYFHITDRHADCFEAMIKDFVTLDCPYWSGKLDVSFGIKEDSNDQD